MVFVRVFVQGQAVYFLLRIWGNGGQQYRKCVFGCSAVLNSSYLKLLPSKMHLVPNQTPLEHHFIVNVFRNPGIEWWAKLRCRRSVTRKAACFRIRRAETANSTCSIAILLVFAAQSKPFSAFSAPPGTQETCCLSQIISDGSMICRHDIFRMRNVRPSYRNCGAFVHGTKFRNFSPIMEQGQSRVRRLYDSRTIEYKCDSVPLTVHCFLVFKVEMQIFEFPSIFNHLHFFSLQYFFQSYAKGLKAAKSEIYMVGDVRPDGRVRSLVSRVLPVA